MLVYSSGYDTTTVAAP